VDASKSSIERLVENATANGVADRVTTHAGDAFEKLRELVGQNARFDAVSLDPPRFAASKSELDGAIRGYRETNLKAMQLLEPGGVLATSSCTGVLTDDDFERVVRDAAVDARRRVQVLRRGGAGPDQADWVAALAGWVEQGKAPASITARRQQDGKVVMTRPLCPHPQVARYRGRGDSNDAASFECALPP